MVQTGPAVAAEVEAAPSRADATRHRILEAASRVFRRQGLHATGMRDIAAELGMHAGNLYYYFRDKSDLLAFCQETTLDRLLALAERVESAAGRADEQLRLLVEGHVIELNQTVPGSLAHLEVEAIDPARRPAILERRDAYEESWRRIVAAGIAAGTLREVDPGTATRALLGAVNWTVKWFRVDGPKTAAELGRELGDLLVDGLAAKRAPAGAARTRGRSATRTRR